MPLRQIRPDRVQRIRWAIPQRNRARSLASHVRSARSANDIRPLRPRLPRAKADRRRTDQ